MDFLTGFHAAVGAAALLAGLFPLFAKKGGQLHKQAGRVFGNAMLLTAASAILLAIHINNRFLLLIGVFSGYLAAMGWHWAVPRAGKRARAVGILIPLAMIAGAGYMIGHGIQIVGDRPGMASVQWVFTGIGGGLALEDLFRWWRPPGAVLRFGLHLSRMIGAFIASLTAFLVVNVGDAMGNYGWIVWLGPTAALVPVIIYWNARLRKRGTGKDTSD